MSEELKLDKDMVKFFKGLVDALSLLTQELCELRQLKQNEFEWFKSHFKFATKDDLKEMEVHLTEAIAKNANITPSIEKVAIKLGSSLDKLDAQVPDKQTKERK